MTQEQIKYEADAQINNRKVAQKRLDEIQELCTHPNTYIGTYSWRIGCYDDANFCSDCGKMVGYVKDPFKEVNDAIKK